MAEDNEIIKDEVLDEEKTEEEGETN